MLKSNGTIQEGALFSSAVIPSDMGTNGISVQADAGGGKGGTGERQEPR